MQEQEPRVTQKNKKSQSALEYLTTYGWAILILAIVAAIVVGSGLLAQKPIDLCAFQYNFTCTAYNISTNGILSFTITQRTGYNIILTYLGCDSSATSSLHLISVSENVPNGGSFSNTIQCYESGKLFNSTPGRFYKGYLILEYTSTLSGYAHTVAGQLIYNIN